MSISSDFLFPIAVVRITLDYEDVDVNFVKPRVHFKDQNLAPTLQQPQHYYRPSGPWVQSNGHECALPAAHGEGPRVSIRLLYILCLRKKMSPLSYVFVIAWSDVIQFCQFLAETYSSKFGTNTNAQATTSRFICSYCTV